MFTTIHPLAILLAGLASMPIGMLWYGVLFGKQWSKLMGFTTQSMAKNKENMTRTYAAQLLAALVQAFVLSLIIYSSRVSEVGQIVLLGFWLWLGFTATSTLTKQLFDTRTFTLKLYLIDALHQLVVLVTMALILSAFL